MKANELRIGNNVLWNDTVVRVDEIVDNGESYEVFFLKDLGGNFESIEDIEPILLTEEWLLKSGCEKKEDYFILERFRLRHLRPYKYFYVTDVDSSVYFTKLEFVHEWQNFYYILQGEELILKSL